MEAVWSQIVAFEMDGWGWTELAKETPGFRLCPVWTGHPLQLRNFLTRPEAADFLVIHSGSFCRLRSESADHTDSHRKSLMISKTQAKFHSD